MKKVVLVLLLMLGLGSCGFLEQDCGRKEVVIGLFTSKGIKVEGYSLEKRDGFCVHHVSFRGIRVPVVYYKNRYIIGTFFDEKGIVLSSPPRPSAPPQAQKLPQAPQPSQTPQSHGQNK